MVRESRCGRPHSRTQASFVPEGTAGLGISDAEADNAGSQLPPGTQRLGPKKRAGERSEGGGTSAEGPGLRDPSPCTPGPLVAHNATEPGKFLAMDPRGREPCPPSRTFHRHTWPTSPCPPTG